MVLALLAGGALGSAAGVALGCTFMERVLKIEPKNYLAAVDISADDNDDIPMPKTAGQPVTVLKKRLLKDTSPWLVQPDYDRVLFINTILELLWPHLSPAIHKTVIQQAKAPLADVCKQAKVLQEIRIDRLDLGTRPPRVDCFKSYETTEDELIVETPAFWGGDMRMRVTAVVKAGARTIDVPVDVANIQFKALARITVKPLVETLPCLGGVTLSLLETPHFNMDLRIGDSWDLMAIPLVPTLVGAAIKWVTGQMLVYPNEFAYPLLPNFGLALPPVGMLKVKVVGAKGLKGSFMDRMDAYVRLEVRKARPLKTKVIPNNENPVWNEEFDFVIDSPKEQGLSLVVKDDDLVGASTEGVAVVPLEDAEFMRRPRTTVALTVPLRAPGATGKAKKNRGGAPAADASSVAGASPCSADTPASSSGATPEKKKGFLSKGLAKLKRKKKPEDSPAVAAEKAMAEAVRGTLDGEGDSMSARGQSAEASTPSGQQDGEAKEAATPPATPRVQLPAGALTGATVDIECTYFPFKAAQSEAVSQEEAGQRATITSVRRTLLTTSTTNRNQQGVLTVALLKCTDLADAPDSYAIIRLYDPRRLPIPNIEYRTDVVLNEDCPRYNYRCDFVNVSAAASLSVVVHEKAGTLDALKSFKLPLLQKASDKVLGRTRISVEDVAKEGRIKDSWPLLEAQTGDIHMVLEWNPVVVDQGESPPQTQR